MLKVLSTRPEDFLLSIQSVDQADWKIFFYKDFATLLVDSDNKLNLDVWGSLAPYIKQINSDFRKVRHQF